MRTAKAEILVAPEAFKRKRGVQMTELATEFLGETNPLSTPLIPAAIKLAVKKKKKKKMGSKVAVHSFLLPP